MCRALGPLDLAAAASAFHAGRALPGESYTYHFSLPLERLHPPILRASKAGSLLSRSVMKLAHKCRKGVVEEQRQPDY